MKKMIRKRAGLSHVNEDNSDTLPLCVAQLAVGSVVDLREKRLSVTKKSYPL